MKLEKVKQKIKLESECLHEYKKKRATREFIVDAWDIFALNLQPLIHFKKPKADKFALATLKPSSQTNFIAVLKEFHQIIFI